MDFRDIYYATRYSEESFGHVPTPWPTDKPLKIATRPMFKCRMYVMDRPPHDDIEFTVWGGVDDLHIGKARALQCLLREAIYGMMALEDFAKAMGMDHASGLTVYHHEMCKVQLRKAQKLFMMDGSELTEFYKFASDMNRYMMGDRDAFKDR